MSIHAHLREAIFQCQEDFSLLSFLSVLIRAQFHTVPLPSINIAYLTPSLRAWSIYRAS